MNPQVLSHPMSVRLQRNAPDPLARQIWLRAWVFYITDSIRPSQQSLFSLVRMEDSLSEAFLCVPLGVEQAVVQTSIEPTTKSIFRKYQMWSSILYGDSFDFLFPLLGIKKKPWNFWSSETLASISGASSIRLETFIIKHIYTNNMLEPVCALNKPKSAKHTADGQ